MIDKTLAHYKIVKKLGEGGMGVVYKAQDTKLGREVALKTLPEEFSQDADRVTRFKREAKLLASLNHPNIAAIHGLEEEEDARFLVLEMVEGETLAERLHKGTLSAEEALDLCMQIAEALEAAHANGIIHRDLKPGNVKITPEGKVKVLDFGLAKAFEAADSDEGLGVDLSKSPTLTVDSSGPGVILGTAPYMSPEQARGKLLDKRTDIWSFGCVLFELLTNKRAFEGETVTDTIAAILKGEPDWETLPEDTPWNIRALLRRCLQKDPRNRLHHIADARIEIEETLSKPFIASAQLGEAQAVRSPWRLAIPWGVAGLIAAVAVFALWSLWRENTPRSETVTRFVIEYPTDYPSVQLDEEEVPRFSPDGRYLALSGYDRLYVHALDELGWVAVPGTEGPISWPSAAVRSPFFSPDSQWVGYFARGALHKVRVAGGAPLLVHGASALTAGASWSPDDTILIGQPSRGLMQISADGGMLGQLTRLAFEEGELTHRQPHVLPGGKHALFTIGSDVPRIGVVTLETGEHRLLLEGWSPHYLPTDHLVYAQLDSLMAVRFDLETMETSGDPVPVVDGVFSYLWGSVPRALYTVSATGSLAYVRGGFVPFVRSGKLVWVNRDGKSTQVTEEESYYLYPRVSPDGRQIAVSMQTSDGRSIWLQDAEGARRSRLTYDGMQFVSTWSPDGSRIAFSSDHAGQGLFEHQVDGSGSPEELSVRDDLQFAGSWSADGAVYAFTEVNPVTNGDIWMLPREGGEPIPFANTEFDERASKFSVTGLLAYVSDQSGVAEVYVQAYQGSAGPKLASTDGGTEPVWSADGRELFYRHGDEFFVVEVLEVEPEVELGEPQSLFEGSFIPTRVGPANYDVSPDGTRFVMVEQSAGFAPTSVVVVLNWFEELKRLVPVGNKK